MNRNIRSSLTDLLSGWLGSRRQLSSSMFFFVAASGITWTEQTKNSTRNECIMSTFVCPSLHCSLSTYDQFYPLLRRLQIRTRVCVLYLPPEVFVSVSNVEIHPSNLNGPSFMFLAFKFQKFQGLVVLE